MTLSNETRKGFSSIFPNEDSRNGNESDNYLSELFVSISHKEEVREEDEQEICLRELFLPLIKNNFSNHYLLGVDTVRYQSYLNQHAKSHPCFLRFSIDPLYQKVVFFSIGKVLHENYKALSGSIAPAYFRDHLHSGPQQWFTKDPWNKELSQVSELLIFATGAYLLGLCKVLSNWPFLCYHNEFLVLFRSESEIRTCTHQVEQELERLNLDVDPLSIKLGKDSFDTFFSTDLSFKGDPGRISSFPEVPLKKKTWFTVLG